MILNYEKDSLCNSYYLENYIPNQTSIYNEGVIKKSSIDYNALKSLNIMFQIKGELNGVIICSFDVSNISLTNSHLAQTYALFTESMNILLGNFLTNLEENTTIMSVISFPEIISDERRFKTLQHQDQMAIHEVLNLEFITLQATFNCQIEFIAKPLKTSMV